MQGYVQMTTSLNPPRRVEPLPSHPAVIPEPPIDLREPGIRAWRAIWSELQVAHADTLIIAQLCRLEDEGHDLRMLIRDEGAMLSKAQISPRGEIVGTEIYPHPAYRELRRCGTEALALAQQLGLTPSSRLRFGLAIVRLAEHERTPDGIDKLRSERAKRRGEPDLGIWGRGDD
jgi:P27 family predicted phage terminase small subunit